MKATYDTSANAMYIELSDRHVARTVEITDTVMIDLDQYDIAVGIELLDPENAPDLTEIERLCHIPKNKVRELEATMVTLMELRVTQNQLTKNTPIKAASRWENDGRLELA